VSDKPYPWSRRMASDVEALDDIDVRYLKAGLRIEWALLQSRPPLIRSDDFWLRITGLKSKRSLELCLAHLAKTGFIRRGPDGSVTSDIAEREWAYREEVSRQKSENRRGPQRVN
jgi:hypothetical protein